MRSVINCKEKIENQNVRRIFIAIILYLVLKVFLEPILLSTIVRGIELLCIVYVTILCCRLCKLQNIDKGKFLILCVAFYQLSIFLRGKFSFQGTDFYLKLVSSGTLSMFLPFVALLPLRKYFDKLILLFYYFAIITIPIWLFNINNLVVSRSSEMSWLGEYIGQYLPFFAGFLLLFLFKFPVKKQLVIWCVYFIYLLLMILNARRNIILSFGLYFLGYLMYRKDSTQGTWINKIINIIFLLVLSIAFLNPEIFEKFFPFLAERGLENTREGVEEYFIADMFQSDIIEQMFGRGLDGTYYQPVYDITTGELLTAGRYGIETGYLDMILKGGFVYVILVVSLILISIFNGFTSKDYVKKRCSFFLCVCLIDLYTTCLLGTLSVKSLLFWVCIGICLSKRTYLNKKMIS